MNMKRIFAPLITLLILCTAIASAEDMPVELSVPSMDAFMAIVNERMSEEGADEADVVANILTEMNFSGGGFSQWPIEEQYALQEYCIPLGQFMYGDNIYLYGLPTDADISEADALAIAVDALIDEYGESKDVIDVARLSKSYYVEGKTPMLDKAENGLWDISFFSEDFVQSPFFEFYIDAQSGEILEAHHLNDGLPSNG